MPGRDQLLPAARTALVGWLIATARCEGRPVLTVREAGSLADPLQQARVRQLRAWLRAWGLQAKVEWAPAPPGLHAKPADRLVLGLRCEASGLSAIEQWTLQLQESHARGDARPPTFWRELVRLPEAAGLVTRVFAATYRRSRTWPVMGLTFTGWLLAPLAHAGKGIRDDVSAVAWAFGTDEAWAQAQAVTPLQGVVTSVRARWVETLLLSGLPRSTIRQRLAEPGLMDAAVDVRQHDFAPCSSSAMPSGWRVVAAGLESGHLPVLAELASAWSPQTRLLMADGMVNVLLTAQSISDVEALALFQPWAAISLPAADGKGVHPDQSLMEALEGCAFWTHGTGLRAAQERARRLVAEVWPWTLERQQAALGGRARSEICRP